MDELADMNVIAFNWGWSFRFFFSFQKVLTLFVCVRLQNLFRGVI